MVGYHFEKDRADRLAEQIEQRDREIYTLQAELARRDMAIARLQGMDDTGERHVTDQRKEALRRNPDLAHTHEVRKLLREIEDLRERVVVVAVSEEAG